MAFTQELIDLKKIENPEVAQQKFMWWTKEINNYYRQKPNHPVLCCLKTFYPGFVDKDALESILETAWLQMHHEQLDLNTLIAYGKQLLGNQFALMAQCLDPHHQVPPKALGDLGVAICLTLLLQNLGLLLRQGQRCLPSDLLSEFDVKEPIALDASNDALTGVCKSLCLQAQQHFPDPLPIAFLNMLNDYYQSLLDEIRKTNYKTLHQRITISPLRTHWIFYKARKKVKNDSTNSR